MFEELKNKVKSKYNNLAEIGQRLADTEYIHNKLSDGNNEKAEPKMIELDRIELIRRMRALSKEEWEIVVNEAPIELCYERIGRELKEAKEFKMSIGAAVDSVVPEEVW